MYLLSLGSKLFTPEQYNKVSDETTGRKNIRNNNKNMFVLFYCPSCLQILDLLIINSRKNVINWIITVLEIL